MILPIRYYYMRDLMNISFRNRSLEKLVNSQKALTRKFGDKVSKGIMMRMGLLRAVLNLSQVPHVPPERCHELKSPRKGQFAVYPSKKSGVRLIFKPAHNPVPLKDDRGIDLIQITDIVIWEVKNYHDG